MADFTFLDKYPEVSTDLGYLSKYPEVSTDFSFLDKYPEVPATASAGIQPESYDEPAGGVSGFVKSAAKGIGTGTAGVVAAIPRTAEYLSPLGPLLPYAFSKAAPEQFARSREISQAPMTLAHDIGKAADYYVPTQDTFANRLAQAGGQMAPLIAASTLNPAAGAVTGFSMGTAGANEEIQQRRDAGQDITPGQEIMAEYGQGLINAPEALLPMSFAARVARRIPGGMMPKILGAGAATAAEEAGTEYLQTVGENAVMRGTGIDPTRAYTEGAGEAALIGGILGPIVGGAGVLNDARMASIPPEQQAFAATLDAALKQRQMELAAIQQQEAEIDAREPELTRQAQQDQQQQQQKQAQVDQQAAQEAAQREKERDDRIIALENEIVALREKERQQRASQEEQYRQEYGAQLGEDESIRSEAEMEPPLRSAAGLRNELQPGMQSYIEVDPREAMDKATRRERSADELQELSNPELREVARQWGVSFDARATSIPRILAAQEQSRRSDAESRLSKLSDKELWDRVRDLGLRSGSRQQNIQTLLNLRPQKMPSATRNVANATPDVADTEAQPGGTTNANAPTVPMVQPEEAPAPAQPDSPDQQMGEVQSAAPTEVVDETPVDTGVETPAPAPVPAVKPQEEVAAPVAKEPWEMTREEWRATTKPQQRAFVKQSGDVWQVRSMIHGGVLATRTSESAAASAAADINDAAHKTAVMQADANGKTISPEVLADYPELRKQQTPVPVEAAPPPQGEVEGARAVADVSPLKSRLKELNDEIRQTRAEMKERGIKRSSMMNGGHTPESMRFNERMFALETERKKVIAKIADAQQSPPPKSPTVPPVAAPAVTQTDTRQSPVGEAGSSKPTPSRRPISEVGFGEDVELGKRQEKKKSLDRQYKTLQSQLRDLVAKHIDRENQLEADPANKKKVDVAIKGKRGNERKTAEYLAWSEIKNNDPQYKKLRDAAEKFRAEKVSPVDDQIAELNKQDNGKPSPEATERLRAELEQYPWWELEQYVKSQTSQKFARGERVEDITDAGVIAREVLEKKLAEQEQKYGDLSEPKPGEVLPEDYEPGRGLKGVTIKPSDQLGKQAEKVQEKLGLPDSVGTHRGIKQIARDGKVPPDQTTVVVASEDVVFGRKNVEKEHRIGAMRLKQFIKIVPEFALDPNFTVGADGSLQFQDGGKYKFNPSGIGIFFPTEPKPGDRIGIDVEAVKKLKAGQVLVVAAKPENQQNAPAPIAPEPDAPDGPAELPPNLTDLSMAALRKIAKDFGVPAAGAANDKQQLVQWIRAAAVHRASKLAEINKAIDPIRKEFPNQNIQVVQSESELPSNIRKAIERRNAQGRVRGLLADDGRIFIVANNVKNAIQAVRTAWHEIVGHLGADRALKPSHRQAIVKYARRNAPDVVKEVERTYDASEHVSEIVARLSEQFAGKPRPAWYQKLLNVIRYAWRRATGQEFNHSDIEHIFNSARKAARDARGGQAFSIAAWHGTPYEWENDRADTSKIGTGEGAQAYGWGLYFSSLRKVAEWYRDKLTKMRPRWTVSMDGVEAAKLRNFGKNGETLTDAVFSFQSALNDRQTESLDAYIADLRKANSNWPSKWMMDAADALERNKSRISVKENPKGRLYQVELAPNEDELLDWDKPLSQQSEKVQKAIDAMFYKGWVQENASMTGEQLYRRAAMVEQSDGGRSARDDKSASLAMKELGIRGIRYLDQSSRIAGEGSSNYVIFDDADIDVKAKFSLAPQDNTDAAAKAWREQGTESPQFKKWFGDSKVVDQNGKPLVVYHGTPDGRGLTQFQTRREKLLGVKDDPERAFFFTERQSVANTYADDRRAFDYQNAEPATMAVYISLQNPMIVDARGAGWGKRGGPQTQQEQIKEAKRLGHDGMIIRNTRDTYMDTDHGPTHSVYVAFSPTQIKSATGNRGTFDPNSPDIRFRLSPQTATTPQQQGGLTLTPESAMDLIRRKTQDEFLQVRRAVEDVQRQGGAVDESSDPYGREEHFKGRVSERIRGVEDNYVKPIVAAMSEGDLTQAEVDQYLIALHAQERNQFIRDNRDAANDSGSGMTDADAQALLAQVAASGKKPALDKVAGLVRQMLDESLRLQRGAGLISTEEYNALTSRWQNYVPLKTDMEEDGWNLRPGRGFSVRGREHQAAMGRSEEADSPLTFAVMQVQEKIVRAEKNFVAQSLLKLVEDNPAENIWEVDKVPMLKKPGAGPTPRMVPDPTYKNIDNVIVVKRDGKEHTIEFKGEQAALIARAMKGLGASQANAFIRTLQKPMSVYRNLQTAWNPEFVLPNLIRDIQTAAGTMTADQSLSVAKDMVKDTPRAAKAMFDIIKDRKAKPGSEMHNYAREYLANGGQVAGYSLDDFEATGKTLQSLLKDARPGNARRLLIAMRKGKDLIDRINGAGENAVRLSAYAQARRAGMSAQKAASIAKNLTVNFNRKGEWGHSLNTLYLFANASIQGNVRLGKALVGSKRGRAVAGSVALSGLIYGLLAPSLFDDDENGRNEYDKLPEWEKQTHLVLPGGYKIPLPYGFNVLFSAGRLTGEAMRGQIGAGEGAASLMSVAANAFSPIGAESTLMQTISPTFLDPIAQWKENTDWAGRPINPQQSRFETPLPNSAQSFRSTPAYAKGIAEWINSVTGGDKIRPGAVDIGPGTIDHFVDWALGGTGRFFGRVVDAPSKIASGDLTASDAPIARRFISRDDLDYEVKAFYDNLERTETLESQARRYLESGDRQQAFALVKENRRLFELSDEAKDVRKQIKELRESEDAMNQAGERDRAKRRREAIRKLAAKFNRRLEER